MTLTNRITLVLTIAVVVMAGPGLRAFAQKPTPTKKSEQSRKDSERERKEEAEREGDEYDSRPRKPMPWGGGITVEPLNGRTDTIAFHIGSPLFLRLKLQGDVACEANNGKPFYFDASGAQLGWGFEEIDDSTVFPRSKTSCTRIIMLSSENSNRIAEGVYSMKVMIFIDEKSRLYSDTIIVHPMRSSQGADQESYRQFLVEQLIRNSPLLRDQETIQALFAEGTPASAESEVYRALVLYRNGDIGGAETALQSANDMATTRKRPLDTSAAALSSSLSSKLRGPSSSN